MFLLFYDFFYAASVRKDFLRDNKDLIGTKLHRKLSLGLRLRKNSFVAGRYIRGEI